jgi:DNA polymerase type B, organellar and viral
MSGANKQPRPFLFLDGEGGNRPDGTHEYVVLCGWSEYTGALILRNDDGSPLSTIQCLEWLLALSARLKAEGHPHTFVGFGFGYDLSMILKDLPQHPAERLYRPIRMMHVDQKGTPKYAVWGPYAFRMLGSEFSLIETTYGFGARVTKENQRTFQVWDIWKFFQGSFVKALTDWKILDQRALDSMEAMKRKRSSFLADEVDDEIIGYCLSECEAGVALMTQLNETCIKLGYPLRRYDGAGSLAAAMLRAWGIDKYLADVPEDMREAVSCAYFGGRFEVGRHGWIKQEVYQYDINSAYPTMIKDLPCLACAEWRETTELQREGLYYVEWKLPEPCYWGSLPHRNRKGEITYPTRGEGWYWGSEILSAERLYPGSHHIRSGWALARGCEHRPFEPVPSVYQQRLELGKSAAGIILKLGLNSLYGKTAQSVGTPKYANYIYAGMITAGCRAMILDAIRAAGPEHVLATATDSVLSDVPLSLPGSALKKLGEWDGDSFVGGILIIQPGITISYDRDMVGTYKSRGLGKYEFARHAEAAETQWRTRGVFGRFTARSHRFLGTKTALARNRYEQRCRWIDVDQTLNFMPGVKRDIPKGELTAHLFGKATRSYAAKPYDYPSQPYKNILSRLTDERYDRADFIDEQPSLESDMLEVWADGL